MHSVRLAFDGQPVWVLIDDKVVCREDGQRYTVHSTNEAEFWVCLLSKAVAKC